MVHYDIAFLSEFAQSVKMAPINKTISIKAPKVIRDANVLKFTNIIKQLVRCYHKSEIINSIRVQIILFIVCHLCCL